MLRSYQSLSRIRDQPATAITGVVASGKVLWARMLHMNGVDMEEIKKGQADMEDVFAYLTSNGREQAKQDATALLNEVFME